jgi:hypothetical protein
MDLAQHDYDAFANKKGSHVSRFKLSRDLKRLERETARIRTFVDKYIAHCDTDQSRYAIPDYDDVRQALHSIDDLRCKYVALVTQGSSATTCKPIVLYDWQEPLRHPWIEMSDRLKDSRLRAGKVVWDKRTSPQTTSP